MELNSTLRQALSEDYGASAADQLLDHHQGWLEAHGDWPRWQQSLSALPDSEPGWHIQAGALVAGAAVDDLSSLRQLLGDWIPWRKGPLMLGGVPIDTEWRSDWKWDRLAGQLDLGGARVLDVGAGNAYFGWRMLEAGAKRVLACDPTQLFVAQHAVISHFAGAAENHLLAARLEDLPALLAGFDCVFSMGVLYHRRDPLEHLAELRRRLRPGGQLVLETLIIPGQHACQLSLSGRYARMRNVYALPSLALLENWLSEAGFDQLRVVDVSLTTTDEQRRTDWMPFQSLAEALDPEDPGLTREGHPAPRRALVLAVRTARDDLP